MAEGKNWALLPLRLALGLMFLAAGIPKLISVITGNGAVSGFFGSLGIPLPHFFAWVVAIVEVAGGVFLLIGLWQFWTTILLSIIMLVIIVTVILPKAPLNYSQFAYHLVYLGGLLVFMFSKNKYMALDSLCDKNKKKSKR